MTRLIPSGDVVRYDGTLEGFCCAVLLAYERRSWPASICAGDAIQLSFSQELVVAETDFPRARRVAEGLERAAGERAWRKVSRAFLSDRPGREDALFSYIVYAMDRGPSALDDIADSRVAAVERLLVQVDNERERMFQFSRFERLENGVWYSRIAPEARVVPLMMRHFVSRFGSEPFVIYDEAHGMAGFAAEGASAVVLVDSLDVPERSEEEVECQRLWKRFYDSLSNEARYNPVLRSSLLPKRLWRNMTEFTRAVDEARAPLET